MKKLAEELKTHSFSRFHLIYGEERYMVRYYRNCLVRELSTPGDEMNCTYFLADKAEPSSIADVGQILPFMAPNRLIVVQDSGLFRSASDMSDYLAEFPETTYIVFVEREIDKRNRLFKWISKEGCVTECGKQSEAMLKNWIAGYVKKAGKQISVGATDQLIHQVGMDMEVLSNELEKLLGFTNDKQEIKEQDVCEICSGQLEANIFEMIEAVAAGEKERSLNLYAGLLAEKVAPMSILSLFTRHINILLQMKELSNLGQGELAKKIGIPSFTVRKYQAQAKAISRKKLLQMLEDRLQAEEDFKSGKLSDQMAVELFLISSLTNA